MSRRLTFVFAAPFCVGSLAGCEAGNKSEAEDAPTGPSVRIVAPRMDQVLESGDVHLMLDLRDYVVSMAKPKEGGPNPYAEGSGQHVHVIVDDAPYVAVYDNDGKWQKGEWYADANGNGAYDAGETFTDMGAQKAIDLPKALKPADPKPLAEGTHVVRVFPSAGPNDAKGAKWHESRKNPGAFAWVRFHVKARGKADLQDFDADRHPTLTYSRPKGEYVLGAADAPLLFPLMLDFYVTGTRLSKDGVRVQASFDGKALDPITEWKPVSLPEAAAGEHTVVIELVDRDGKPVPGPFQRTERKITVR
jgi:hypothetical protein